MEVLAAGANAAEHAALIVSMVEEYGADIVVLGLPLNMDGSEGPQAALTRRVVEELMVLSPQLQVVLHDERLTSHAADGMLAGRELTRRQKRARQDAVAAKVLLESYLAVQGEREG